METINKGKRCQFEGCGADAKQRGWCPAHYQQWRLGIPLRPVRRAKPCSFEGCDRQSKRHGFCDPHSRQAKKGQPLRPIRTHRSHRTVDGAGYVRVYDPGHPHASGNGWVKEHIKVMTAHLGRPLLPGESVHHVNGQKADNRLSNLELWARSQPSGQRVTDLLAWAREVVARYEPIEDKL